MVLSKFNVSDMYDGIYHYTVNFVLYLREGQRVYYSK